MKQIAITLTLVLGLLACKKEGPPPAPTASGQPTAETTAAETAAPEAPKPAGRPFLYRVEGQGDKKGSGWLLGTIHMGGDPDDDLHPIVWERFDAAKKVVLEADVGSIGPAEAAKMAFLPDGQSLRDKLTPEQWEKLDDMSGIFMPESSLARMKPSFALALVVKELLPKTEPMDGVIQERAKKAGKALAYLETVDEQVKMLDEAIDAEVLAFSLDHADEMKTRLEDMLEAYLTGDEAKLRATAFDPEEMKAHPEMFETLFYRRNSAWIGRIEPLLAEGDVFIAVGCGHLVGDKSVVDLLQKAGWRVTREAANP